ncbi:hypothetical protein N7490_011808 [Penicillium lividum]|nr:hypothetical protein N7490_011808 [Penicillium lividum]
MIIFFLPVFLAFHATYAAQADSLAKGFASPSTSYGPHVFWHWVNGNIRAAALDEDVDALYESGHGGALISDVNAVLGWKISSTPSKASIKRAIGFQLMDTVVRMGYTATGQEMPATPDSAFSLSVDLFSKDAIDAHFDTHLTKVINALKPYIPNTFYGFEVDSYELGMQNWGGDILKLTSSRDDYDIISRA